MDPAEVDRRLEEGIRLEQSLRWSDAADHYTRLLENLRDGEPRSVANVRLRRANAWLQLRRFDDARREFDAALEAAKAATDSLILARALLGAGVFAASRGDVHRGEDFLLAALDAFHHVHSPEGMQGGGWALANLAAIYGRTKRLDLAFVTFEKARERLFSISDWAGVAAAWEMQAQLRASLGDEQRAAEDYHESMSFYEKQGMTEKVEELRRRLGGRRVV